MTIRVIVIIVILVTTIIVSNSHFFFGVEVAEIRLLALGVFKVFCCLPTGA